jgi:RNA polymerase sigma-70 factor (ECF subfamily)
MADGANQPDVEPLLARARSDTGKSLGRLLELYRNYLQLLACTRIDLHLQGRVDASDVVQEAYLDACRDFGQFRGQTEAEFRGWLRQIPLCNLARLIRQQVLSATPQQETRWAFVGCHWPNGGQIRINAAAPSSPLCG